MSEQEKARKQYIQEINKSKIDAMRQPGVSQCCATCEYLADDGLCKQFNSFPPFEFIKTQNECDSYLIDIPF